MLDFDNNFTLPAAVQLQSESMWHCWSSLSWRTKGVQNNPDARMLHILKKCFTPVGIWCNCSPAGNPQSFPGWAVSIPPGPSQYSNNALLKWN